MNTVTRSELCRITVEGPARQVDLAVPASATFASLLPVLVGHTVGTEARTADYGSWAVQRLGESPLDPDGTPETLDLLEGERLYLVPASNPMPELNFDDVADGMATAVNRQRNRWQHEYSRWLFLSLSGVVVLTMLLVLQLGTSVLTSTICAGVLAGLFSAAAIAAGRWLDDLALTVAPGLAAGAFAAFAGLVGPEGMPGVVRLSPIPVLVGGLCATGVGGVLLAAHYAVARRIPFTPFVIVVLLGLSAVIHSGLRSGWPLSEATGLMMFGYFVMFMVATRLSIRAARLRGPQLPKTADELQLDLEPHSAADVVERTSHADRYLSSIVVSVSLIFAACFPALLTVGGWLGPTLVVLFAASLLLRARHFSSVGQRLATSLCGTAGFVVVVLAVVAGLPWPWHWLVLVPLAVLLVSLVLAATRPATRSMLPLWGFLANITEFLTAFALLPLLMLLLGVFAMIRGLGG